jgi:PST family polysaccharide transporter
MSDLSDEFGPRSPANGSSGRGLEDRVARGLTWTLVDTWGRQALNLAVFLVLARLLEPADFGLVTLAAVFVQFAQLVVDQGLGDALIQRRDLRPSHIDTAFWVAVATGLLLTVALLLLAGPIAAALNEPGLAPILQVLSLTFVLSAFTSIQVAILRRQLAFRSLAARALAASLGGGVVGIAMALLGFGAWALVGQLVASAILSVLALWWVTPWRPSRHWSRAEFRELFGFGAHVMAGDILTFLTRNMDNLLIGAFHDATQLGYYGVGYRILSVSQTVLVQVTRKVSFPAFSLIQDDRERMRRAYFRVTRAAAVVILPGYIGLSLVATELTVVFFGARWEPSGQVATILFLIGPVLSVQAFSNALLNAAGHPDVAFRFRLVTTVVTVAGFAIAVPFGIIAVAAAFVARGYLLLPLNLRWMERYAGIPTREYLVQLRGVALATALMAAAVLLTKLLLGQVLGTAGLLGVEALVAIATFPTALWLLDAETLRDVSRVVGMALPLRRRRRSSGPGAEDRDTGDGGAGAGPV